MTKVIGALYKLGLFRLDRKLHLHHHFTPVEKVHEDVLVTTVQPVLQSDDFDARVGIPVPSLYFFIDSNNLFLF